jgi:hypothetical protein
MVDRLITNTGEEGPVEGSVEGFDTYNTEFVYEHGVGLTVYPRQPAGSWLSWDETVAFHEWLGQKIKEANDG